MWELADVNVSFDVILTLLLRVVAAVALWKWLTICAYGSWKNESSNEMIWVVAK